MQPKSVLNDTVFAVDMWDWKKDAMCCPLLGVDFLGMVVIWKIIKGFYMLNVISSVLFH